MNAQTPSGTVPILLIEDEPSVTAFLRAALERHGYAVVNAASGAEGLNMLSGGKYSGVISDIRMPGAVNGAEVHAWIQKNRPELCARIILISGDTANSETQTFLAQSGTPCIEKPFRVQELMTVVEKTFGKP
jgi:DNA-binding response OmpR family regulator